MTIQSFQIIRASEPPITPVQNYANNIYSNLEDDILDAWITTAFMTELDGEVTVNAQVTNNTGTETDVQVIATAYDSFGKMLSYAVESANIATSYEFTFTLDVSKSSSEFTVKVFTWDKATYVPLSNAVSPTMVTYTVTFNLNYDGAIDVPISQKISNNGFATKPADPTRDGYTFAGWYTTPGCLEMFLFENEIIKSNITLYASWIAINEDLIKDNVIEITEENDCFEIIHAFKSENDIRFLKFTPTESNTYVFISTPDAYKENMTLYDENDNILLMNSDYSIDLSAYKTYYIKVSALVKEEVPEITPVHLSSTSITSTPAVMEMSITLKDQFSGNGNGTSISPYLISSANQLKEIRKDLGASYKLIGHIDLRNTQWTPIGDIGNETYAMDYNIPRFGAFSGVFDGAGYTISGLYINNSESNQGLFGVVKGGTIKNLGLVNSYVSGGDDVGGIVGLMSGLIDNCYNTGYVSGNYLVGGIVGGSTGSYLLTVRNCYNTGNIFGLWYVGGVLGSGGSVEYSYNTGNVSGTGSVGGVLGGASSLHGGSIGEFTLKSCYNTGNVTSIGDDFGTGGVVGSCSVGKIDSCYNTGNILGNDYVGGVVGFAYEIIAVRNCYNSGNVSGHDYVGGVIGWTSGAINNCHYLSGSASSGIGNEYDGYDIPSVSASQLKTFAPTLGSAFKNDVNNINDGYPILIGIVYETVKLPNKVLKADYKNSYWELKFRPSDVSKTWLDSDLVDIINFSNMNRLYTDASNQTIMEFNTTDYYIGAVAEFEILNKNNQEASKIYVNFSDTANFKFLYKTDAVYTLGLKDKNEIDNAIEIIYEDGYSAETPYDTKQEFNSIPTPSNCLDQADYLENKLMLPNTFATAPNTKYDLYKSDGAKDITVQSFNNPFQAIQYVTLNQKFGYSVRQTNDGEIVFEFSANAPYTYYKFQHTQFYGATKSEEKAKEWTKGYAYAHIVRSDGIFAAEIRTDSTNEKWQPYSHSYIKLFNNPDIWSLEGNTGAYVYKKSYNKALISSDFRTIRGTIDFSNVKLKFSTDTPRNAFIYMSSGTSANGGTNPIGCDIGLMSHDGNWYLCSSRNNTLASPTISLDQMYRDQYAIVTGYPQPNGEYMYGDQKIEMTYTFKNGSVYGTVKNIGTGVMRTQEVFDPKFALSNPNRVFMTGTSFCPNIFSKLIPKAISDIKSNDYLLGVKWIDGKIYSASGVASDFNGTTNKTTYTVLTYDNDGAKYSPSGKTEIVDIDYRYIYK